MYYLIDSIGQFIDGDHLTKFDALQAVETLFSPLTRHLVGIVSVDGLVFEVWLGNEYIHTFEKFNQAEYCNLSNFGGDAVIKPVYKVGGAEWQPTSPDFTYPNENKYGHSVCECGHTSCGGGRGCGHCGECSGEHCECHIPEFPHGEDIVPRGVEL